MRISGLGLGLALGGAGLGCLALPAASQDVGLEVGTVVKPVVIEDLEGKPVDLAEWIGTKPVLFEFWATWCPLCKALEPRMAAVEKKYGDAVDVVVIAVAVNQSKRSILRHSERHPMPGRVLWDTDGRATRAFMAPSTSYVVVLDRAGRVVYTGVGEEQDLDGAVGRALR